MLELSQRDPTEVGVHEASVVWRLERDRSHLTRRTHQEIPRVNDSERRDEASDDGAVHFVSPEERSRFAEVWAGLCETRTAPVEDIQAAILAGDFDRVKSIAGELKQALSQFEAHAARESAVRLENFARRADIASCVMEAGDLALQMDRLQNVLDALLEPTSQPR